ncbi:MAG: hypothetical protein IRZ16_19235 [Myxococcaceae bacterium]|nr:hypothetical protein [Myxococcaceae bacterium]
MAKGRQRQKKDAGGAGGGVPAGSGRMKRAFELFDRGDKVLARREAKAILADHPTEAEATEAKELLTRMQVPKEAFIFAALAAVFILGLILIAIART